MNVFSQNNMTVFQFETSITGDHSITLQNKLKQLIDEGKSDFLFQMENVENIDTTGICAFITLKKQCGEKGKIEFQGTQEPIALLLKYI